MPARVLGDGFVAELQGLLYVGETLTGQSNEHEEGAEGRPLILAPGVQTEGAKAGQLGDVSRDNICSVTSST